MSRFHYASTLDSDMLYHTRYSIVDPFFFLETGGKKYVFLSTLDSDAFRESHRGEVEAVDVGPLLKEAAVAKGDVLGNLALRILKKYGVEGEVAVPASFPVSLADFLREKLVRYIVLKNWCPERALKSPEEISAMRENFEHTRKAYVFIEEVLHESIITDDTLVYKDIVLTSEYLKREVSKMFFDSDLVNVAGIIISSGHQAALPHHAGAGPIRPNTTIVVDIFPQSSANHYFSDMTRTYVKGKPSAQIEKMYTAVFAAQKASLSALKPGLTCQEAYEISANVIKSHGFDVGEKGYMHSLGHGLGVAVHESPTLSSRSQAILEAGQVVTIEPGLYYPNIGGVRIEDTVLITKDGYEDLTQYPYNWIIA